MMRKILVVDDNMENRQLLHYILEQQGYDPILASSGKEALGRLTFERVDLIISDLEMPNGDGQWLLKEVSELKDAPGVIIFSGNVSIDEDQLLKAGALAFYRKPFSLQALIDFVASQCKTIA